MKKILIPTLLATSVAPIVTLVSCNKSGIVLDKYTQTDYGAIICTKQTYEIEPGAKYTFTIDMNAWKVVEKYSKFSFIITKKDEDLGEVKFDQDFKFTTDKGEEVKGELSGQPFPYVNINFKDAAEIEKIRNCSRLDCYITVAPEAEVSGEYYFSFFGIKEV